MSQTFLWSAKQYSTELDTTRYSEKGFIVRQSIVEGWIWSWKKILDVGCYNWVIAKHLSDWGNVVFWLDASSTAIDEFNSRWINGSGVVWDLEEPFPFDNESFDVIHAGEIIEHLYDTDSFLNECYRVLKKDWVIIITTPNVVSLGKRIYFVLGRARFFEASNSFSSEGNHAVGHIRFFDKRLLVNFMKFHGFSLINFQSDYVNFPWWKSVILARLFPGWWRTLIASFKK